MYDDSLYDDNLEENLSYNEQSKLWFVITLSVALFIFQLLKIWVLKELRMFSLITEHFHQLFILESSRFEDFLFSNCGTTV